ncbi:TetR/AcrR family transcriptional regulator [Streptomyces sp. NPDC058701]|uniref:TetR/AcrR family transcriptional regulator n=1 Tax=Streptomyces sp. NPDC058701 TaxID=3346608 RepID=UPI00365B3401
MSSPSRAPDRRTLIADAAIGLVSSAGLRGLTHRAVDGAAGLPVGSTSYYFRTRTALIGACYHRLVELDFAELDFAERDAGSAASPAGSAAPAPPDLEAAVALFAGLLYRWLTVGRERHLARFELSLEAARTPDLAPELQRAGRAARARAATVLAALGAEHPEEAAELLAAWTDGILYDRLAGAPSHARPAPDPAELTRTTRRMLNAALNGGR